ncbi:Low-molecular weight cobalt-containing nitrile hydratase subunit beta [Methylobacterium crusticola]|uniref:Nitrile hydratase subunit beta n=1 Tax=Methylobacterium crusticola TaxID=1697972 RepID=A0ABQ4R274_9HYPH|nr:nitrile hydratase subunit beta [Methylobacterium crusticola]GJD51527.1 Low-molecular weight cobalt-containing nitrile hydratase subunit beta [Methylobacterium crusticola]
MNGGQDLGGMQGFGPVGHEADEPWFHADWERRVFAMAMALGLTGTWNLDASRAARESLPPGEYLTSSYYAIWFKALERQVQRHGLVEAGELAAGAALAPPAAVARVLKAEEVAPLFARGFPSDRAVAQPARFAVGDEVTARLINPRGHTRLPRYVRGRTGVVERVHGGFVFPDSNAHFAGEAPQWLYTVRFSGIALWGEEADPNLAVSVNAFESYLEPPRAEPPRAEPAA